jgi:hypothetical protein
VWHGPRRRFVEIDTDDPAEAWSVPGEDGLSPAAGIERVHHGVAGTSISGLGPGDHVVHSIPDDLGDRGPEAQSREEAVTAPGAHHAVAVAASVMPSDSSQRSASMAALQPSPAAVIACR